MDKTICELFAGVGGFRLGFERTDSDWKTVWFNQWEPKGKKQDAYECYIKHFGKSEEFSEMNNTDISKIDKKLLPDFNVLVGGFPCQDYSVAHSLAYEKGIEGKKGVLWWDIYKTIKAKNPPFCLFENVDRLLKSPSKQRGRDFGIILTCLNELGYSVEWRVVNAGSYGAVQKRQRTFIFAYNNDTKYGKQDFDRETILNKDGFFAKTFPIEKMEDIFEAQLSDNIIKASDDFSFNFQNAGWMHRGMFWTAKITEQIEFPIKTLGSILEKNPLEKYYVSDDKYEKFKYLKSSKKLERTTKEGFKYMYSEGAMAFPDDLNKHGRTMLTSEGTVNRCSHIIKDNTNKFRILTPLEAERMQGFDDNWTNTGMSERMRYFCMGNALVVPMIEKMAKTLSNIIEKE